MWTRQLTVPLLLFVFAAIRSAPVEATPLRPGEILVTTGEGVLAIDPATPHQQLFSTVHADNIAFDAGRVVVTAGSSLVGLDVNIGVGTVITTGGLLASGALRGLDIALNGDIFVVVQGPGLGAVVKVDPLTGNQTLVAKGLEGGPNDVAVALTCSPSTSHRPAFALSPRLP